MACTVISHTSIDSLADLFIEDVLAKENFGASGAKGGFLTGGNVLICESKGLQEYLQKKCVDKHGIWTALPFKPLAGLLMQYAYNLSDQKKDEKDCIYNQSNLLWAIYNLLEGSKKTFSFANELSTLFNGYQIYRPDLIEAWNEGKPYDTENENETWQRELWTTLKKKYKNEQDISQLYKTIEKESQKIEKKQIFIFAPLAMAPVHLKSLTLLAKAGCKVNLYLRLISGEYIGDAKSDKSIVKNLSNRLIANLGRSAQILYEQIGWENLEPVENDKNANSLLEQIQQDIINDDNTILNSQLSTLSLSFNNCLSPLREIEVLCDYMLDLFVEKKLSPADIAVVSPRIETYASAIEMVFGRYKIPYKIADRDVKKYDKTTQLAHLLFSLINTRYEAPDVVALFEYSMFAQGKELDSNSMERLEKWVRENAIRHGLTNSDEPPNYSFKSGFNQLAAGFFMISENGFSDKGEFCYPDIEGSSAGILGDFVDFVNALEKLEEESKKEKSIEDWDSFLKENLQPFFGSDEADFNEEDNPYQKIIGTWDLLKREMLTGFGVANTTVEISVLKNALLGKMEANARSSYSLSGDVSFSNVETVRAVPYKVICCIGMNSKEFPRQNKIKEISIIDAEYRQGDKDKANEDRLIFLETICSAKEKLYISWVDAPSSTVAMLLKNLKEQYGIDTEKIVVKHPLQPQLPMASKEWLVGSGKSAWEWEIDSDEAEGRGDVDELYRILSDVPKYFLRNLCNIELPEDIALLESIEPFIVENALDKWQLMKWVLDGESEAKIKIEKLKGKLPNGKFADKIIEKIVQEAEELGKGAGDYDLVYPSNDKGKYRLKHWIYHLDLNSKKENQETKMFLRDQTVILPGMPKENAREILNRLWEFKRELGKKLLPIFPNAAWEYLQKRSLANAWEKIDLHSQYAKMAIGNAQSFEDLGIEEKFVECSERLFAFPNYPHASWQNAGV